MDIRRTPFAVASVAVSLGLLAACSDEADRTPDVPAEQVTPAPAPAPDPVTPPAPMAPDAGTTMPAPAHPAAPSSGMGPDTVPGSVPDPSSSSAVPGLTEKLAASGQAFQESARNAAHTVGEKAGDLRDATGERMAQVGQAIRDGAARADEAIQESVNRDGMHASQAQTEPRTGD
ncbi:MAG: hypothetical protein WCX93_03645 [Burkholderiaceae bacterium]